MVYTKSHTECDIENAIKNNTANTIHSDTKNQQKKLIDLRQLLQQVPLSKSAIYRFIKTGEFPAPIKIGQNRSAWRVRDVDSWIDARAAGELSPGKEEPSDG